MNGCRYLATNPKRSALDIVDDLHGIADPEARRLSPGYVDGRQSSGIMEGGMLPSYTAYMYLDA
jgi:hypothetical protein